MKVNRRQFLGVVGASLSLPELALGESQAAEWGSPVLDLHFHLRAQPGQSLAHLDGAGIAKANLLARATAAEQVAATQACLALA